MAVVDARIVPKPPAALGGLTCEYACEATALFQVRCCALCPPHLQQSPRVPLASFVPHGICVPAPCRCAT